ncbi:MAG TPA: M56 family metallopeptidase [Vicinamibacterales bacterium]
MTAQIFNHLWQSTAFAVVCALTTLALRNNRAQVRYALWFAASAKFLIPFSVLSRLGTALGHSLLSANAAGRFTIVLEFVGQPLVRTVLPPATRVFDVNAIAGSVLSAVIPGVILAAWSVGALLLTARWVTQWYRLARISRCARVVADGREVTILRRLEGERRVRRQVIVLESDSSIEPGVFGWFRPRLLWPRGISAHFDDSQVEAILAHELSHVGRHDNLIAAVQMVVQVLFWFHPLVWWIGVRLVDERERACDEDVLQCGNEPDVYAGSILTTCRFAIESPLTCVAGVTGADLKRRIETILNHRGANALSLTKRVTLSGAAVVALAGPVGIGVVNAPRVQAQADTSRSGERFEVASIKPNDGQDVKRVALLMQPGGRLQATNVPLSMLVRFAYAIQEFQIIGLPDWKDSERFDLNAKAESDLRPGPLGTVGPLQKMMQALLADRFELRAHVEKREMPIYALVVARADGRLGPGLRLSTVDCAALMAERARRGMMPAPPGELMQCGFRIGPGQITGGSMPLSQLANSLSNFVQRVVVDRTGLNGNFDLDLKYTLDQSTMANALGPAKAAAIAGAPSPDVPAGSDAPGLLTALQEQLGLKLESARGQVDVLVIEHVDKPAPD